MTYKYHNVPQTYNGRSYRSRAESTYAWELDQRKKIGEIVSWEYEPKIELKGENGGHVADYKIDFMLMYPNGLIEYVEVKGFETDVWRLKWKLFHDKFDHDVRYKITLEKR